MSISFYISTYKITLYEVNEKLFYARMIMLEVLANTRFWRVDMSQSWHKEINKDPSYIHEVTCHNASQILHYISFKKGQTVSL